VIRGMHKKFGATAERGLTKKKNIRKSTSGRHGEEGIKKGLAGEKKKKKTEWCKGKKERESPHRSREKEVGGKKNTWDGNSPSKKGGGGGLKRSLPQLYMGGKIIAKIVSCLEREGGVKAKTLKHSTKGAEGPHPSRRIKMKISRGGGLQKAILRQGLGKKGS